MIDLRDPTLAATAIIAALRLAPHPEGGHYRETYREGAEGDAPESRRGAGTAILFLLAAGEASHWHRVDADELWLWHAGAPLALRQAADGSLRPDRLGPDLRAGESPQILVARHTWQAARSLGAWTLVSCTVTPAFRFAGFELAPVGWEPS